MPVLRGRIACASATPRPRAPAVIVNEAFARRYFDRAIRSASDCASPTAIREIVGVVANVQQRGGFQDYGPIDALPSMYVPFAQFPAGALRVYHGWFSTGVDHARRPAAAR